MKYFFLTNLFIFQFTKNILFENCKDTDWWVKNISPSLPVDNKINFEAEVGFGEVS